MAVNKNNTEGDKDDVDGTTSINSTFRRMKNHSRLSFAIIIEIIVEYDWAEHHDLDYSHAISTTNINYKNNIIVIIMIKTM